MSQFQARWSDFQISETLVRISSKTYPLAHITSIDARHTTNDNRPLFAVFAVASAITFFVAINFAFDKHPSPLAKYENLATGLSISAIAFVSTAAFAIAVIRSKPHKVFHLVITSSASEIHQITFASLDDLNKVYQSIRDAISAVPRGQVDARSVVINDNRQVLK